MVRSLAPPNVRKPRKAKAVRKRKPKVQPDVGPKNKKHSPDGARPHIVSHISQDSITLQTYVARSEIQWRESRRLNNAKKSTPPRLFGSTSSRRMATPLKETLHRMQQQIIYTDSSDSETPRSLAPPNVRKTRKAKTVRKRKPKVQPDVGPTNKKHSPDGARPHIVSHISQDSITLQTYVARSEIHWRESRRLNNAKKSIPPRLSGPTSSRRMVTPLKETLHRM